MRKGIMGLFGGGENKKETGDYRERGSVVEPRVVECASCGAKNLLVANSVGECEYCGSTLTYSAEDETAPSVAAETQKAAEQNTDLTNIPDTYTLSTGFYTAGIDIPVGKCNINAVSGSGNLFSSDDDGISEVFGVERGDVKSFKGLKLPKDVILTILGELTIKLDYKSIDEGFSGRTYNTSGAIEISTGNYEAGKDFAAGTYNIVAVSGSGNLFVSDSDVSEIFGLEEGYVPEVKHVYLPKGTEVSLEGDLSAKLIPAAKK